jgi:hypothetical protein
LGGYSSGEGFQIPKLGTYFYKGGDTWDKGPYMNYDRLVPACGIITSAKHEDRAIVIVAAGDPAHSYFTTEVLDSLASSEWELGLYTPLCIIFYI